MIIIFLIVIGLALGSFVNALVWRIHEQGNPKKHSTAKVEDLSITRGRSMCPACRHQLSVVDLLPVLSWLWLMGKCRYCHKAISVQYPIVEVLVSLLFAAAYIWWPYQLGTFGAWLQFASFLPLIVLGVALALYDLKWMMLPNRLVYFFCGAAILWLLVTVYSIGGSQPLVNSLLGALSYGGLFYVIYQVSGGKWIGGGDVRLGFVLGIILGWQKSIIGLTIAAYLATAVVLLIILMGKYHKKMHIPFGPFLLMGMFLAVLWGQQIIEYYYKISGIGV